MKIPPNKERLVQGIIVAFLLLIALWTGWRGVDFGEHWDEHKLINSTVETVTNAEILPHWYNYPSVSFYTAVFSYWTFTWDNILPGDEQFTIKDYLIRTRSVFVLISCLAILFVFLFHRAYSGSGWKALLSAALMAGCWEYGYHARWIAPDLLMTVSALAVCYFSIRYFRQGKLNLLFTAAILAGVCAGSKYPGGSVFILPLLAMILLRYKRSSEQDLSFVFKDKSFWIQLGQLAAVFIVSFLITTPGALFETGKFLSDIQFEMVHYREGAAGYTVYSWTEHIHKLGLYFLLYVFSPWKIISICFALLSFIGLAGVLLKKDKAIYILLAFPVFYLLYFSTQKIFFARNYMVLVPFAMILVSEGVYFIIEKLKSRSEIIEPILLGIMTLVIIANLGYGIYAAETIHNKWDQGAHFAKLETYILGHQEQSYLFSRNMTMRWGVNLGTEFPNNVFARKEDLKTEDYLIVFSMNESMWNRKYVNANVYDFFVTSFGSMDVNWNYYSTWLNDRILVMKPEKQDRIAISYFNPGEEIPKSFNLDWEQLKQKMDE